MAGNGRNFRMPYKDQAQEEKNAKERKHRYLLKKKIAKYGPDSVTKNMTGKHGNHVRSQAHFRWNDNIVSSHGYIKVRVGIEHPLADSNGYAYEHLLVWISSGNRKPSNYETLHHRTGNKKDNRLSNLIDRKSTRLNSSH